MYLTHLTRLPLKDCHVINQTSNTWSISAGEWPESSPSETVLDRGRAWQGRELRDRADHKSRDGRERGWGGTEVSSCFAARFTSFLHLLNFKLYFIYFILNCWNMLLLWVSKLGLIGTWNGLISNPRSQFYSTNWSIAGYKLAREIYRPVRV